MLLRNLLPVIFALLVGHALAEPTESRTWTSTSGTEVTGVAVSVGGGKVKLELSDGRKLEVPVDKLSEGDREFLAGHFGKEAESGPAAGEGEGSGAALVTDGLAHPVGQVVGPIDAGGGSHYFVYVPKSLRKGRLAPLLHFNGSGGGNADIVSRHIEGAEINGWIVAANVESMNGPGHPLENHEHARRTVEHLVGSLPIDAKRVYFTGGSGGGAMSFYNQARLDSAGAMPYIGYIPADTEPKDGDFFVINGTNDYNRYPSAVAVDRIGKDAIHRFFVGGHDDCPDWLRVEGMVWLNGRYLAGNRRDKALAPEALDYEVAVIQWIRKLSESEAHRAYYWCRFLQNDYRISGANASVVGSIASELAKKPVCVSYADGIEEISKFSEKNYVDFGTGSKFEHTTPKLMSSAEKLSKRFAGVPMIAEIAEALGKPTCKQ